MPWIFALGMCQRDLAEPGVLPLLLLCERDLPLRRAKRRRPLKKKKDESAAGTARRGAETKEKERNAAVAHGDP